MRRFYILLALTLAWAVSSFPQAANAVVVENTRVPLVGFEVFIPCANGGQGETITLQGNLHVLVSITFDNAGGARAEYHFQPMGVSAVGPITGHTYRATGLTRFNENFRTGQPTTYVNNFYMIGTGRDAVRFRVHETVHVTINGNGTVTATVSNVRVTCD